MITPKGDCFLTAEPNGPGSDQVRGRSRSENCARIKDLGFATSKHITMYGESFEIVSDPFSEGDCVAVRATSGSNPEIRTLRLPTTILVGGKGRFLKKPAETDHLV